MLRYAVTIFLSAFLLFQVQPLISKRILPWFGGSPAVWTSCMLFFQAALLAGYLYAHLAGTRLGQRRQVVVHVLLLVAALAFLPIYPGASWKPGGPEYPTWRIIVLLAATVGLPYFILAATSPLLQKWFTLPRASSSPGGQASPYRLYALSNAGSLLALASYPFLVEPNLSSRAQATVWSLGFVAFAAMCGYCAIRTWNARPDGEALPETQKQSAPAEAEHRPGIGAYVLWLLLPASASVMLLAVTNQICQDIAVFPFLWILPLGLYLLSFIICFDRDKWYWRPIFWPLLAVSVAAMCWMLFQESSANMMLQAGVFSVGLFAACMVCHGELVRLKPAPRRLTSFYLMIAAGGALGGILVAVVAPHVFKTYLEINVGIWSCCAVALAAFCKRRSKSAARGGRKT